MRIAFSASGVKLTDQVDAAGRNLARAVTIAVAAAAEGAKLDMRRQLDAFSGDRMGRLRNAIQSDVKPRPPRYSPRAAATVYGRGEQADRLFSAFAIGPTILPKRARALAIPLHNYRDINGQLLGPRSSFFAGRLVFVPAKVASARSLGVLAIPGPSRRSALRRQRNTVGRRSISAAIAADLVPQFVLVRLTRLPRILRPIEAMQAWSARLPELTRQALARLGDL